MTTREQILKETREWLGTPYRHQHAQKGLGTDCLGLLVGVYTAIYGKPDAVIPAYSQGWDEVARREDMLIAAEKYLVPCTDGIYEPGNVLVFRMKPGAVAKHCAIVTEPERMIHAYQNLSVTEVYLVPYWKSRIAGVFKFPEVV
jgi:NlpC/P60 family putative phage cell wall peptidase